MDADLNDDDLDARIESLIAALSSMGEPHIVAEDCGRRTSYEIEHLSKSKWDDRAAAVATVAVIDGARGVLRDVLAEVRSLRAELTEARRRETAVRAVAEEAIDLGRSCAEDAREYGNDPSAFDALRARLASPSPAPAPAASDDAHRGQK